MTPMTDSLEFPHGTTKGYAQGCRSQGACPGLYGQTCSDARTRAASDYRYGKAVAKDREVEYLKGEHEAAQQQAAKTATRPGVDRARANQERAQSTRLSAPVSAVTLEERTAELKAAVDERTAADAERRRQEAIDRGVHEDGRPFHAPAPPLPTKPVMPSAELLEAVRTGPLPRQRCAKLDGHEPHSWERDGHWYRCTGEETSSHREDREAERRRPTRERNGMTEQQRRSRGQLAAHAEQARHAIATATAENPLGLTQGGVPRNRLAPGTVLVDGQLVYRADLNAVLAAYPTGLTEPQQLAAIRQRQADPAFADRVRETATVRPSRAQPPVQQQAAVEVIASGTVPSIVEEYIRDGQVPGVSIGGTGLEGLTPAADAEQDRAFQALLRLQALIGTTDWRQVADTLTTVADSIERMAELGLAVAQVKRGS